MNLGHDVDHRTSQGGDIIALHYISGHCVHKLAKGPDPNAPLDEQWLDLGHLDGAGKFNDADAAQYPYVCNIAQFAGGFQAMGKVLFDLL